jgi:photosystem II stability/assembly factor-like uncharacterized protein
MPPRRTIARAAFASAVLSAASLSALAQIAGWQTSGPPLPSVNGISTAADAEDTVYAGASQYDVSQSGLFVSTDGGRSWTRLFEAERGDYLSDILADPRDGDRLFAGVLGAGGITKIFRSTDRGGAWSLLLTISNPCVPSFAVGSGPDGILFVCGTRFFRSGDAGLTWAQPPTPFTETTSLAVAPGGTLYAYGSTKIFRSANAGDSWTAHADAPPGCPGLLVLRLDPSNPSVFLAGTGRLGAGGFQCGGVYRSENAGSTWTASSLTGVYVTDIAVAAADPPAVYASASYIAGILPKGGVFGSSDGGATFQDMHLPVFSALHLALSPSGRLLHAATPSGAFELRIRKTRVLGPR